MGEKTIGHVHMPQEGTAEPRGTMFSRCVINIINALPYPYKGGQGEGQLYPGREAGSTRWPSEGIMYTQPLWNPP